MLGYALCVSKTHACISIYSKSNCKIKAEVLGIKSNLINIRILENIDSNNIDCNEYHPDLEMENIHFSEEKNFKVNSIIEGVMAHMVPAEKDSCGEKDIEEFYEIFWTSVK